MKALKNVTISGNYKATAYGSTFTVTCTQTGKVYSIVHLSILVECTSVLHRMRRALAGAIFLTSKSNSLSYTCQATGEWNPNTVQACVDSSAAASLAALLSNDKQYIPPAQEAPGVRAFS